MPQRQDYLLRLIEELGRFVAEATKFREVGHYDAALLALLRAQERLFARPAQDFTGRTPEDLVRLLTISEPEAGAVEKCAAYAGLILEAGAIYQAREQPALALGACRYALDIVDLARQRFPAGDFAAVRARAAALLAGLPDGEMKAAVLEQLGPAAQPNDPLPPAGGPTPASSDTP